MSSKSRSMLLWYVNRLRAMDAREVAHRIIELFHKTTGRLGSGRWAGTPGVRVRPATHIGEMFSDERISADLRASVSHEAARVRSSEFAFLGQLWPATSSWPLPAAFWHLAPNEVSVPDFATGYCADALFRSAAAGRDLKRIWEVNRLQFLLPLAVEAKLSGGSNDRDLVFATIFAWMDANPPYTGLSYAAGIELAVRVISVATVISVLGNEHLSDAEHRKLSAFFSAHELWLARFPSLYSSENNHRIAELAGLMICSTILDRPAAIRQGYLSALSACLLKQFHADGVGAEQAPTYAAFSVELSLIAFAFAQASPEDVSAELRQRLKNWATYTLWLMDGAGRVPEIGDNDAGRGLALTQAQEPRYVASVSSMLAAWLGSPELSPPAHDAHLRDCLFSSACGAGIQESGVRSWPDGGYSIFRGGNASFVLIFDHGPVGHLSIAAHGHADTLAVWLTVGDTPVLIDAGTTTYRSQDPLRNALRHTRAHNTLTVGDLPSSVTSGAFNWSLKAEGRVVARSDNSVTATHNGYLKRLGVVHRREVKVVGVDTIRIVDVLETNAPTDTVNVESGLLFGPSCVVRPNGTCGWTVESGGQPLVEIEIDGPLNGRRLNADAPDAGEYTTAYGELHRTSKLVCEGALAEGARQVITIRRHRH